MGGVTSKQVDEAYFTRIVQAAQSIAITAGLLIACYTILAYFRYVPTAAWYTPWRSLAVAAIMMLGSVVFYYCPRRYVGLKGLRIALGVFHIMAFLLAIFLCGFLSPLSLFWSVLIVISYMTGGWAGIIFSAMFVAFTASFSLFTLPTLTIYDIVSRTFMAVVIYIVSQFMYSLYSTLAHEHRDHILEKQVRSHKQQQLAILLNSISEAIISIDAHGTVQFYNASTLALLDTNQSLVGKKITSILKLHDVSGAKIDLLHTLQLGATNYINDEWVHQLRDGEVISLSVSSSRIRDNDDILQGYILVVRDITKEKSLDEERDEFISVVSHELRTPVTIVEGTLSNLCLLLQRDADTKVIKQSLKASYEQTMYLSRMINDLSTLSRAERGIGAEQEAVDINELLHELYIDYEKKTSAKKLRLDLEAKPKLGSLIVSRLYLEEILQNFLTNAIKYTQQGTITLGAKSHKGKIVFYVTDTGIGISKREHTKIFDKFYRSEDYRTRETSGTGLGLYIVRKLASRINGTVQVESQLNHGSTFSLVLPATIDKNDKSA